MASDHGMNARYQAGCRCRRCRQAHVDDEARRLRQIAYGRWQPFADAELARAHVRMLGSYGIGWKRTAELAGLSAGTVNHLMHSDPPSKRVQRKTLEAILSVEPRLENAAPKARVDATGTRRRIQALAAAGWPLNRIARELGWRRSKVSLVLGTFERVTVPTALAVRALYEQLWDKPCPAANGNEAAGIRKAKAHARRMGWAPPAAWDDIDDPRDRPKGVRREEGAAA